MAQSQQAMSRRSFGINAVRMGLVAGGVVALSTAAARADSPNGWTVRGPVHRFNKNTNDGRNFLFEFADVQHQNGAWGVLLRVTRPNRPPAGVVVPAARLPEFSSALTMRGYQKSFVGDVFGGIKDILDEAGNLIKLGEGFIKGVVDDLQGVQEAFKQLVRAILKVFDRFSSLFATFLDDTSGGDAVAKYAVAVRDVARLEQPLAWKCMEAVRRTLSQDYTGGAWTIDAAQAILSYDGN